MPGEDSLETHGVEHAGLNELEEPGFVLGPSGLERNSGKVFGGKDQGGRSVHVSDDSFLQRFFHQRASGRQELNGPAADDDILTLHRAAVRLEVIEDALGADQQPPRPWPESHEYVHIQRRDGFEVKGRSHRAANGVTLNHALGLHPVDGGDDGFDVHIQSISGGKHLNGNLARIVSNERL